MQYTDNMKSIYDEYSDSIPPQNYDWTICLLAKTVSKGKTNEPFLHSFDSKHTHKPSCGIFTFLYQPFILHLFFLFW